MSHDLQTLVNITAGRILRSCCLKNRRKDSDLHIISHFKSTIFLDIILIPD